MSREKDQHNLTWAGLGSLLIPTIISIEQHKQWQLLKKKEPSGRQNRSLIKVVTCIGLLSISKSWTLTVKLFLKTQVLEIRCSKNQLGYLLCRWHHIWCKYEVSSDQSPLDDLIATVKKRKLKWCSHIVREWSFHCHTIKIFPSSHLIRILFPKPCSSYSTNVHFWTYEA